MFKGEKQIKTESVRKSKLGKKHKCTRIKTLYIFQCDNCGKDFERAKGKIEKKRLTNFYKHVCHSCNPKKFAQQQGVKQRQVLRMDASSDTPISSL
tara:strand:- start:67 stop:354 length:288 start_codon:yes stop_codon:yes gene_type:complete